MKKPDNPPAFPSPYLEDDPIGNSGMTLRDWFAGQVLSGTVLRNDGVFTMQERCKEAYEFADDMLAQRKRRRI